MKIFDYELLKELQRGLALLGFKAVMSKSGDGIMFITGQGFATLIFDSAKGSYNYETSSFAFNIELGERSYQISFEVKDGKKAHTITSVSRNILSDDSLEDKRKNNVIIGTEITDRSGRGYRVQYMSSPVDFNINFETFDDKSQIDGKEQIVFNTEPYSKKQADGSIKETEEDYIVRGSLDNDGVYKEKKLLLHFEDTRFTKDGKEFMQCDNYAHIICSTHHEPIPNKGICPRDALALKMALLAHPSNSGTISKIMIIMRSLFTNYRFDNFAAGNNACSLISETQFKTSFDKSYFYVERIEKQVDDCMNGLEKEFVPIRLDAVKKFGVWSH